MVPRRIKQLREKVPLTEHAEQTHTEQLLIRRVSSTDQPCHRAITRQFSKKNRCFFLIYALINLFAYGIITRLGPTRSRGIGDPGKTLSPPITDLTSEADKYLPCLWRRTPTTQVTDTGPRAGLTSTGQVSVSATP